jgi:hypothetical protein
MDKSYPVTKELSHLMSTVTRNLITQSRETHNNAYVICEEVFPEVVALNQKDVNTKYKQHSERYPRYFRT